MAKSDVFEWIDTNEERLKTIAHRIWETPEVGLQEEESSAALIEPLESEGFEVERNIGSMPTSFVASYGETGPKIGILGEYDALPELSQKVTDERESKEDGAPGHGCGHNLLGTAGVGAAIAVKEAIDAGEIEGTVVYYGCPSEENLVGKIYMARAGVFDDLDAALTWHPNDLSTPSMGTSNAVNSLEFTFEGVSAHAARSPESGRSALDAVQLLNTGVEYMREHLSDDARIHYTITDGGQTPNVVPATASVWYFVRAPTREEVERNTDWLRDIAEGAALMTQTTVDERLLTGCYDYRANETVTDVIWENMQTVEPVTYDDEDVGFARDLQETIPEERREAELAHIPEDIRTKIEDRALYSDPVAAFDENLRTPASTDVGDVSWITPTGQFRGATWPVGTPGHSWQIVAANGSFGQKSIAYAAKVLAGSVYDLMKDPERLETAQEEFETMLGERSYESPLPDDAEPPSEMPTMTD
jgi:aminobenzoyl-glutamate utilization protein B